MNFIRKALKSAVGFVDQKRLHIDNEATQFNGKLSRHLIDGDYLIIHAVTTVPSKSFYISLATAKLNTDSSADIGLHIVVQLEQNKVTANNGSGCDALTYFSFDTRSLKGIYLQISINIKIIEDGFYIAVNDEHKLKIGHRLDVNLLDAIQIGGDVNSINRVDHRTTYPTIWPPFADYRWLGFSSDIPVRFKPGHLMVIKGRHHYIHKADEFSITIRVVYSESDLSIFNYRFDDIVVAFNDKEMDEVLPGAFHELLSTPFCVGIAWKMNELGIAVNGIILPSCVYRNPSEYPLSSLCGIRIDPDVKITEIDHFRLDSPQCIDFQEYTKQNVNYK